MGAAIGTLLAAAGSALAGLWASATAAATSAAVSLGLVAETAVFTSEVIALDVLGAAFIETGLPTAASILASGIAADAITYQLTATGVSLIGLVASGALLGASYGVVHLAINSGKAIAAPLQPFTSDILSNTLPCTLLDILNDDRVQCRKRKRQQVRLDDIEKSDRSMYDPEEEVLLPSKSKSVPAPKRRPAQSPRVGQKVNRVRRKSPK